MTDTNDSVADREGSTDEEPDSAVSEDPETSDRDEGAPFGSLWPEFDPETFSVPSIGEDPRDIGPRVPAEIQRRYPVEPDRVVAVIFAVVLGLVLVTATKILPVPFVSAVRPVSVLGVWVFAGLYLVAAVAWGWYTFKGWWTDYPPIEYGPEDVQVRILTIDAESIVQQTVDTLPDNLTDRHVVAETDIDIKGATVHVVPDSFECTAAAKGRALEWARRSLSCDKEYVLFLDEDSLVTDFEGLPDADVVQFREWPYRPAGGSWLAYWSEILRMGYQLEQVGYADSDIPLYSWGGGLAVRKAVEDEVTWNFETLIEDTVFAWFAVANGASFEVVETKFRNQAPPSLTEMFNQRRRWFVGTVQDEEYLPLGYQLLLTIRNVVWAFSPIVVVLTGVMLVVPHVTPEYLPMQALLVLLLVLTGLWVIGGIRYYGGLGRHTLPLIVLLPLIIALHSFGALLGCLAPPQSFQTTAKTSSDSIE